jgi:hypothetical protein
MREVNDVILGIIGSLPSASIKRIGLFPIPL